MPHSGTLTDFMDVETTPSDATFDLDDPSVEPVAAPPAVVAVLITRNAGPWFEATLESLGAQDYPGLTVLVIDAASDDDPTPRVASVLPNAFVRRIDEPGFGRAANEVMATVEGADFLCFCHDDIVLAPGAIRLLVEEAFRSNAAISGPKIVDADEPKLLREVGWAIDRFCEPHSYVEPGEYDQEQHYAVRDVFFVSNVAMLVRTDLFAELGGFDIAAFPGAEDLDLCWRARLLGARVVVVPDSCVAHHEAAADRTGVAGPNLKVIESHRVRVFMKNSSRLTLAIWVPIAMMVTALEALVLTFTKQRAHSRAVMAAWWGQAFRFLSLRPVRKPVQKRRVVDDAELRYLRVGGSARVRRSVRRQLFGDDTRARLDEARGQADTIRSQLRRPIALLGAFLVLCFFIGSRDLVLGRVRAVGSFLPWQGVTDLFGVFFSGWRGSGMGTPALASPAFAFSGLLSTATLGADALARSALVVGAVPLGALAVSRCVRLIAGRSGAPTFAAATAYLVSPVWRNAIGEGRLGALIAYVVVPFVILALLRAGTTIEAAPRRRLQVRAGVLLALALAFAPGSLLVLALVIGGLFVASPLVGASHPAHRIGAFEHGEVAVDRTLGHFGHQITQLGDGARPAGPHERVHQRAPARGVPLAASAQPCGNRRVGIGGHRCRCYGKRESMRIGPLPGSAIGTRRSPEPTRR